MKLKRDIMTINILAILLILTILIIIFLQREILQLKNEQRINHEKIRIHCHNFKTSLTTLHLLVDGFKDYSKLEQDKINEDGRLSQLLDILDDVGHTIAQSIAELVKQVKIKSKPEGG